MIVSYEKEVKVMTVIMGYKTPNKIYLGADNRTSTVDNTPIRDDINKIVTINDNVAVAFSGYHGTQIMFENMTKNNSKDFRVEDALCCIKIIYWICKISWYKKYTKNILQYGSRFIIAGKNRKDEYCIYTMSILNGKLEKPSLTDRFMFPPDDVDAKVCVNIYAVNATNYHSDFIQKTVKDIAKISKLVSSSGDIWTYDLNTDTSNSEHFN